jgi:hypothetical protein
MGVIRNNRAFTETVLIENSDERLAAVEEAKRTGQPFQSVGANKAEIVPVVVAQEIMDEASMEDIYVGPNGTTFAAHLQSYHEKAEDPNFITETNEEKAAAHHAHSAEFVRQRNEEEVRVKELMAEGYEPSLAVQQANYERAMEHEKKSIEYAKVRIKRNEDAKTVDDVMEETVKAVNAADPNSRREAIEAAKAKSTVPDVSESATRKELEIKDKIVETVEKYEDHALDAEALKDRDHPAVEILESAGSPEELRRNTGLAQAAAQNPSPDQTQLNEVREKVARKSKKKPLTEADAEAREEVMGEVADEMKEPPTE